MQARRATALFVLAALVGSLGLPWFGDAHRFNDDPHWAVALGNDCGAEALWTDADPGDEAHCEVCHWLRTMRTATQVSPTTVVHDVRPLAQPATSDSRTLTFSLRSRSARAPPAITA
jgi:hypothetical protein